MPTEPDTNYELVRPDILDQLHGDGWFVACFDAFFRGVGRQWGCDVKCSGARLLDACSLYHEDIQRTLTFGMDGKQDEALVPLATPETDVDSYNLDIEEEGAALEPSLDHFKHGAFLAYWLKRNLPINSIEYLDKQGQLIPRGEAYEPTPRQKFFSRYGNEYCALLAGFKIVLNYQLQTHQEGRSEDEDENLAEVRRILKSAELPDRFVNEFPRLLKHKNISPHALYMTFCALFERVADPL